MPIDLETKKFRRPRAKFESMDDHSTPTADLLLATGSEQAAWHERALECKRAVFGNNVFVRGVVEISNFCRENCTYCGMRRDHRDLPRFRLPWKQLADHLLNVMPDWVRDLDIQAGEDPRAVEEIALPLIRELSRHREMLFSVCLGTLNEAMYRDLREAGASIYIMKFEAADPADYSRLQAPGTLPERLNHIRHLAMSGWNVSSGFISGLPGQTMESYLSNFRLASELPLYACSVSPFIPGDNTPLAGAPMAGGDITANSMAALRILRPTWIIPAVSALNIATPGDGYVRGLKAGANLVTANFTPNEPRANYVLYKRNRCIMTETAIRNALEACGAEPAPVHQLRFLESCATPACSSGGSGSL